MTALNGVSVAIATFNRAAMVSEAIGSALAQTVAPLEICVTDDASTDETWDRLQAEASADPRVRIFRQRVNSGGVENWNHAIRQTRGAYIAWCSDDDRFLPDHLEASVEYLEVHPEVGLVHSGFIDAVETGVYRELIVRPVRFATNRILRPFQLPFYLLRYYDWPFHPSTIVMRRDVWNEVGPFDAAYALADTDWFARAAGRYPVAMLARHGVLNRRHPGNWSNRLGSARMQNEIRTIVERALDRQYPHASIRRAAWKTLWRLNVRVRLMLTLWARLKGRRAQPARAAWAEVTAGTVMPKILTRFGEKTIERWCRSGAATAEGPRESVSPH